MSTAPDVGLVVAAAAAPGTFAPSLSSRTALDQGLVTGLATGLHFLLTSGAQDALVATARFLVDGTPSPTVHRIATIAVDAAAVPLGLAVLRALPPRADDPLRGAVRQAAWRLGATGLGGALLGGAQLGTHALDDRLRLGGRLAAVPLAVPVGLGIAYVVDRLRAGKDARTAGGAEPAPRCRPSGSRRESWGASPASPTASTSSPTSSPAGWPRCCPDRPTSGGWPATRASSPRWDSAPPRSGTGPCGRSRR